LGFASYLNLGFALQNHVEFVLACVRVRSVLLAGFKTVESGEEGLAQGNVGLRHFLGGEFGVSGEVVDDHLSGCGYA